MKKTKEWNKEKIRNLTALFISLSTISLIAVLSYRLGLSDQLTYILKAAENHEGVMFEIKETNGKITPIYMFTK